MAPNKSASKSACGSASKSAKTSAFGVSARGTSIKETATIVRIAIVFPGQGTQAPGMAREWKGDPAWSLMETIETAAQRDVSSLILDANASELAPTDCAQLAVLATSLLAWQACGRRLETDHQIVGFAGHSLGQVTALIAAGVIDVEAGVRFARDRAAATQAAALHAPGKMAALIGATIDQATQACAAVDNAWIANDNAPGQIVIAGTAVGVDAAIEAAKALGVRKALPLAVGGAFHTPLMASTRQALIAACATMRFKTPSAPVVSNHDAQPHTDAIEWRDRLIDHPTQPVRWRETMLALVDDLHAEALIEVGCGTMIAGVAKRTLTQIPVYSIHGPPALDACRDALVRHTSPHQGNA